MDTNKIMANCTIVVEGIVAAVMRYRTEDASKRFFPDTPEVRRKAQSYAIQAFNSKLNHTPFNVSHSDICEAVCERLKKEGYLQ